MRSAFGACEQRLEPSEVSRAWLSSVCLLDPYGEAVIADALPPLCPDAVMLRATSSPL